MILRADVGETPEFEGAWIVKAGKNAITLRIQDEHPEISGGWEEGSLKKTL